MLISGTAPAAFVSSDIWLILPRSGDGKFVLVPDAAGPAPFGDFADRFGSG